MATVYNRINGANYVGIPDEDAQALCDEWNEGLNRSEWFADYRD